LFAEDVSSVRRIACCLQAPHEDTSDVGMTGLTGNAKISLLLTEKIHKNDKLYFRVLTTMPLPPLNMHAITFQICMKSDNDYTVVALINKV